VRAKALTIATAAAGCTDYADLSVTRHAHLPLIGRILELRDNFTAYDAAYVALAEMLDLPFLTGDERLARAVRRHLPHVALA
jgi:predicted nucleic acid-binding protein